MHSQIHLRHRLQPRQGQRSKAASYATIPRHGPAQWPAMLSVLPTLFLKLGCGQIHLVPLQVNVYCFGANLSSHRLHDLELAGRTLARNVKLAVPAARECVPSNFVAFTPASFAPTGSKSGLTDPNIRIQGYGLNRAIDV
jgi:hypothetical protein